MTRPRLSSRTLVLTPSGVRVVGAACPEAVKDIRIRSEDLRAVLAAP